MSDDVCAISLGKDGVPQVFPSYPQLKLWADAIKTLERNPESLRKVRPQLEKYALPLQDGFARKPMPFHSVYVIGTTNTQDLDLQPLQGTERFQAIANNTYRIRFLEGLGPKVSHFGQVVATVRHLRVCRVTRPRRPFLLDELADLLEKDFA